MYSRVPDEWFHQSRRISVQAQALHLQTLSYCQLIRLDGRLPKPDIVRSNWLPAADVPDAIDELITYGLWEDDGEAYWVWADPTFEKLQYTAEQQEAHRIRNRDKQRRRRANAKTETTQKTQPLSESLTQPNPTQDITQVRTPGTPPSEEDSPYGTGDPWEGQ